MLACVLVSEDRGAGLVHPFVAVGVIEVAVSVDEMLDGAFPLNGDERSAIRGYKFFYRAFSEEALHFSGWEN